MLRFLVSSIAFCCLTLSCSNDDGELETIAERSTSRDDWTPRTRLLDALQVNVYTPTFERFAQATLALRDATTDWDNEPSAQNLETVQNSWKVTMLEWQIAELMQIGPAGAVGRRLGGMDLRDRIYSYPVTNSCRVDQELVRGAFTEVEWVEGAQFNVRGLDAIEYLIFGLGDENTCPVVSGINRNGEWAALKGAPEVFESRRTSYVRALAQGALSDAEILRDSWQNVEGTFAHAFVNASTPFVSEQDVVNQVFAGLFYADKVIKDLKLGKPAGITDDCAGETCPESSESRWSKSSKNNLVANLRGLKMLFFAGEDDSGYGFDDLLVEEGAEALALQIGQKIEVALDTINQIDGSVEAQLTSDANLIHSAHQTIRDITDDLKSQFVTVLNLSVPQEGAGDND
jgi:uncharacterized protein